jgi:hypothetical protein
MTTEASAQIFTALIFAGAAVVTLAHEKPHWISHQWGKWEEITSEGGLSEIYLIQQRACVTCGYKQQRASRRPI